MLKKLFNSCAKTQTRAGLAIGFALGTSLYLSQDLDDHKPQHITYDAKNYSATLPSSTGPSALQYLSVKDPANDTHSFANWPGISAQEAQYIVDEHYARIQMPAWHAMNNHYTMPEFDDVIKGYTIPDITAKLDINKDYDHQEIKSIIEANSSIMLRGLDYRSYYLTDKVAKYYEMLDNNQEQGYGIEFAPDINGLFIKYLESGPAAKAGLKAGDVITHINDTALSDLSYYKRLRLIKNLKADKSSITVQGTRHNSAERFSASFEYGDIETSPIRAQILDNETLYVQLKDFTLNSAASLKTTIKNALGSEKGKNSRNIIIDLRDNGGGYVHEVNQMLDDLSDGDQLGYIRTRISNDTIFDKFFLKPIYGEYYNNETSSSPGQVTDLPITILVDNGSASASEIFAGNLQDIGRAKVVGSSASFGKGTMQSPSNLKAVTNDSAKIYLTNGLIFLPKSGAYQGIGIIPDILVGEGDVYDENKYFEKDNPNILANPNAEAAAEPQYRCSYIEDSKTIWGHRYDLKGEYNHAVNLSADPDLLCAIEAAKEKPQHVNITPFKATLDNS